MKKIEKNLEEVGTYFKEKLKYGEYEFISCNEHTATLKFYGMYLMDVWIANDPKITFGFYSAFNSESLIKNHLNFSNQKDRMQAFSKLKPHLIKFKNTKLKEQKEEQIKILQQDIEKLNK